VKVRNINPYLVDASDLIIMKSRRPICAVPEMTYGSMPNDGGYLLFSESGKNIFLQLEPNAEKWIKRFVMGDEFINNVKRYCLWLVDVTPNELRTLPEVLRRVEQVKAVRLNSTRETTRELANQPTLFGEYRQPKSQYLALPRVSSENRRFIPIAFLPPNVIAGDKVYTIENASIYDFGVITSSMHMAWMRTTAGRLKSDYSYTNQITYNSFPWPTLPVCGELVEPHKASSSSARTGRGVEVCAQAVLDARAAHTNASLADLYDPLTMPANLLKAHQVLDKAVDAAYAYKGANTDAARVAFLF
jgi:hypothetical protein